MTNDNNIRTRASAVFFSVIMVLSMVTVGFAGFAGSAAAADSPSVQVFTNNSVGEDTTVTHDVRFTVRNVSDDGDTDSLLVSLPPEGEITGTSGFTVENGEGDPVDVTSSPSLRGERGGTNNAVAFGVSPDTDAASQTVVVEFTATVDWGTVDGEATGDVLLSVTDSGNADVSDAAIQRVTVSDTDRSGGFSGVAGADVSFADASELSGERVYAGQVVAVGADGSVGDSVVLRRATGPGESTLVSRLTVAEDDVGNRYVRFETADRQPGDYFLTGAGFDRDNSAFEVVRQDLTAEFDAETVDNDGPDATTNLTIESEARADYDAVIAIDGFDEADYDALVDGETALDPNVESVSTSDDGIRVENASGDHRIDFTGVAGGDVRVTVSVVDADAEATAPVTVNGVTFADDRATVPQGDVADVTITFHGTRDTAYLRIGDADESGYVANVRVEADGADNVTVGFNTYTAGSSGEVVTVESTHDDATPTVTLRGQRDAGPDMIATGEYRTALDGTGFRDITDGNQEAVGTLVVTERATGDMVMWRTADAFRDEVVDAQRDGGDAAAVEAIADGVEDGVVTQTYNVSFGNGTDVVVHQVPATGLQGALAAQGANNTTAAMYGLFTTTNTYEGTTIPVASLTYTEDGVEPPEFNEINAVEDFTEAEFHRIYDVVYDEATDDYYVFLDLDAMNEALADNDAVDAVVIGDSYTADFTVKSPVLTGVVTDDVAFADVKDAYQSAAASFGAVEATADFGPGEIELTTAAGQNVTGRTNVAPGTELSVRIESDESATNFTKDATAVVRPDGTFAATFDFSDQRVNDTFTVTTRNSTLVEELSSGGRLVALDPAVFEVSALDPADATVTAGDSVTVSATVENTGDVRATESVALTLDGEELDARDVTLDGGDATTVEFTADTSGLDAGDYEHGVSTPDDEATGTLTVEANPDGDGSDGDGSEGTDSGDGATDDSTPGLGVLAALVALLGAALLAARRAE